MIHNDFASTEPVARVSVPANVKMLAPLMAFVRELGNLFGLSPQDSGRLELLIEEACSNVVQHAFDSGEEGSFDVVFYRQPGQLIVAVEDKGLPFDMERVQAGKTGGLGTKLMRAFADEIRFENLGKRGKRVSMIKHLRFGERIPQAPAPGIVDHDPAEGPAASEMTGSTPVIRLMHKDEAPMLARCLYRSYGYSYVFDDLYFPERVREMVAGETLVSAVAATESGEILGHVGLTFARAGAPVGESGKAFVDPRIRGGGLFKKMKSLLVEEAKKSKCLGMFSECVTIHPYTQKGNLTLGATEVGVQLGMIPPTMYFKNIQAEEHTLRQATILMYLRLNREPQRKVFAPYQHCGMIGKIYENAKMDRIIIKPSEVSETEPANTVLDVTVTPAAGLAFLGVRQYGKDFIERLRFETHRLAQEKIESWYLDLPLSDPRTVANCAAMEILGYFFAGVIPELNESDCLRLQFLNYVEVDPAKIATASSFGKELLEYVLAEYAAGVGSRF